MDLPVVSACFLAFALTVYVILDGFDLGVGILLLFQPAAASRDHMVDSITPTWDGNETWIIMAGVTLLAAFPVAYSVLLPAFYLPIILMLLALGFRGVSFEFRVQSKQYRRRWDVAFAVGSLVAAVMQGLVLGGLMQGVTVQNQHFAGSVLDVVRPLPVISGLALAFGYAVLGGGWLKLKSSVSLQAFANRSIRVSAAVFAILFGLYLCGQDPAGHPLEVGLTWNRSCLPCRLVWDCLGPVDDDQENQTRSALPSRPVPVCRRYLGYRCDCVSRYRAV
jgi:cytochrome d ubiquinol oxidase subunit II